MTKPIPRPKQVREADVRGRSRVHWKNAPSDNDVLLDENNDPLLDEDGNVLLPEPELPVST